MRTLPSGKSWLTVILVLCPALLQAQSGLFDLPPLPAPETYGNVLINRLSPAEGEESVGFSHWSHRTRYTCRVCHFELDFAMVTNASEITEEANRQGRFCGACHNDKIAFGHTEEHCSKCHSGRLEGDAKAFRKLRKLPSAPFGNKIDWVTAEERGLLEPTKSLFEPDFEPLPFRDEFEVDAAWTMVPPAHFSHNSHLRWLDCSNCHPDVFTIEQEGTENLLMQHILEGKFCGACHLTVAFPIDYCRGCHTKMRARL